MPSKPDFAEFYKRHFEAVYRICYIFMQNAVLDTTSEGYFKSRWNGEKYYYCFSNTDGADKDDHDKPDKVFYLSGAVIVVILLKISNIRLYK